MATVALPYTLTAGTPENVTNLQADLDALVAGVNHIATAQIDDAAVTTAKIADANVTADKLSSTLAGQLGISQTGATRYVTVTQTAETTVTSTTGATIGTSSSLTVATGGVLRIAWDVTGKGAGTYNSISIYPEINIDGTWVSPSGSYGMFIGYPNYYLWGNSVQVANTTYRTIGGVVHLPSGAAQSATNAAQFRMRAFVDTGTGYLKNLTATMTYIAA